MTILFFSRLFYPHLGGVEKHVMELSKILLKKGHKVIVITESLENPASNKDFITFHHNGINVYAINNGKNDWLKKFRIWKNLWQLKNLINKADIIHCHDVFFWYLPFRFIYPIKPVFTTFHGYESFPIKKKAILIRKLSEKLSLGNICIGDFIKKYYGTNPNIVSYGAVNVIASDKGARQSLAALPRNSNLHNESALFFGRLDEQTGIIEYLKAFQKIKEKHPHFRLLVIGDGKYKNLTAKKTKVISFQKNPEKYFKNYRFAFVSRYLSILEALASKRLVFALYDNPVKEDYLKMSPFAKFIIIEKDPLKLSERISYYLNHPDEENKLITQGYNWAIKQTWDSLAEKYLSLWKKSSH